MKKRITAVILAAIMACGIAGCGEHSHEWGEWIETKAATCTEKGEETRVCAKDGAHKETRETEAKGHEWGEWKEEKAAGCVMAGRESRVCKRDASHKESRSIEAKGHDSAWRIQKAAGCENQGIEELYCESCKKVLETRRISVLGHAWGEWKETKAATCTDKGEETRVCGNNAAHKETRETAELGHAWGEWIETKAATLTEKGEETRICARDGKHKETRETDVLKKVTESIRIENGEEIEATENAETEIRLIVKIKYEKAEEKSADSSDVTYSSSNQETATVNGEGVITIKKPGEAEITVESINDNAAGGKVIERVRVKVKHARLEKLEVTSKKSYSLIRGIEDKEQGVTGEATAQIDVRIKYEGYEEKAGGKEDVRYESSDEGVASVDENGKITFNGPGTATIRVESIYEKEGGGKMEESITVQVNNPPENTTGLEVVSFETGINKDNEPYLHYTVKNTTDSDIAVLFVDVYYLDATGKILGIDDLYIGQHDGSVRRIQPNEEVEEGIAGGINFPEETVKILIYNRRTSR